MTQPCEECVDEDEDGLCDVCGEAMQEEEILLAMAEVPVMLNAEPDVTYVAQIGDDKYTTLAAAFAAIGSESGEDVELLILSDISCL